MKYTISIDHELRIIRYKHSGIIHAEDIEDAWSDFLKIQDFTQNKYELLSDYRNGKFQMKLSDLSGVIGFMHEIENIVKGKKQALIVDNPYSVATSILFKNKVYKEIGFNVKVFSTEPAALKWLID